MISDSLYSIADKLSAYALSGVPMPASTAACIARVLMDYARQVAVMETLPISVTMDLINAVPETTLIRAAEIGEQNDRS